MRRKVWTSSEFNLSTTLAVMLFTSTGPSMVALLNFPEKRPGLVHKGLSPLTPSHSFFMVTKSFLRAAKRYWSSIASAPVLPITILEKGPSTFGDFMVSPWADDGGNVVAIGESRIVL